MRADTHDGPEQNRSTSEAYYIVAALTFVGLGTPSCNARPGHTYWHVPEELISVGNVRFPRPNGQSHYVLVSTRLTPTGHLGVRYSITSSICASSDGEIVRPSACAVLILSTVWNFVGCSTGRSPGFAPLMILST